MLNEFFINILLLVSVTFVGGHIIKDISPIKINMLRYKLLIGAFCGLLGILLIIYSVSVEEVGTFMDLRVYAILMASYVGGFIPTIISGIIILVFRLFLNDYKASFLIAFIQVVLFILSYYIIDRIIENIRKRWICKVIVSMVVLISTYYILLRQVENVQLILFYYSLMVILAGALEYILLDYVKTTNEINIKYKQDATKDFLTGLTNTRQFDSKLNMAFERVQRNHESLTCLMVDIDYFKKVNDTYGHAVGDIVLKELADILKGRIRTTDVVARIGGEEFCALLFQCSREESFEIGINIKKAVQEHQFPIGDKQFIHITVSIGVSIYPDMTDNLDNLKELADTALYTAKRSGRNRVCDNDVCKTGTE